MSHLYQDGISKATFPAFALAAEASFGAQAAVAAPSLRSRSYFGGVGSAKAGRQFSILTYRKDAPRAKLVAAFPSAKLRTGRKFLYGDGLRRIDFDETTLSLF